MQTRSKIVSFPWGRCLLGVALAVLAYMYRTLLWQAVLQLLMGMLVALAALPLMRLAEKKLKPGLAASCSMMSFSALLIVSLLLLLPPIIGQFKLLVAMLPSLYTQVAAWMDAVKGWLAQNGLPFENLLNADVLEKGGAMLSEVVPGAVARISEALGSVGRWMLAPAFAYYFLRDRKRIGSWLLSLLPVAARGAAVRMLREMRRETFGYLRGQLLISAIVGSLTALGLLICGVPAWLLLGLLMGVLELIPYVGPFVGGLLVALFSLPGGLTRTLWALGVVLLVQQVEGGMLAPQMVGDATRLHPVAVLLCVMLGGTAAGVSGILFSVPLLLCARAALRVYCSEFAKLSTSVNKRFAKR